MNYSKGPWIVEEFVSKDRSVKQTEIWNQNTHIATINHHSKYEGQPLIDAANAKLISAAPEMLEALEFALEELKRIEKGNASHEPHCVSQLAIGMVEEAIKKAKGEL